ncbi:MAG: hypothetical protein WAV15_03215 [Minisyncoccia bacterium]
MKTLVSITLSIILPFMGLTAQAADSPQPKSKAFCLSAVTKGLVTANPKAKTWSTSKPEQQRFMSTYYDGAVADLHKVDDDKVLQAIATGSSAKLQDFFAKGGFANMPVRIPAGGHAVGVLFDLLVDWKTVGEQKDISIRRPQGGYDDYSGAQMLEFEAFSLEGHKYPLFRIETRQGWDVYLVEAADGENLQASDFPARAKALLGLPREEADYEKLNFPSVLMSADVDISWMVGMRVPGFSIDEAVKKIKLRLDEKGARAQSAVAFTTRGMDSSYTIQRSFYVIFTREGLNFPPFVALAAPDSWVKQGSND